MRPLIEDATTRGLVQRTVMTIASAIAQRSAQTPVEIADHALLRSYLANEVVFPDPEDKASRLLGEAVNLFSGTELGLDDGAARLGWTIAHLAEPTLASDRCARLDQMLLDAVERWTGVYDWHHGLVGFGIYALARGEAGIPLASRVLDRLEQTALRSGDGIAWPTPPHLLPPNHLEVAPEGYWNLGLPHGIPGIIALLARFVARGIQVPRASRLLHGAVEFILSVPAPSSGGRYPPWLPNAKPISTRLAWCYGDLGVATAILGAGLYANEQRWVTEGLALARSCAARTLEQARIHDAGLCHGTAGIAHMFHRIARATNDEPLRIAARAWTVETLRTQTDAPIAGYPRVYEIAGELMLEEDASLLTGCTGVALALHAAISEVEPAWDRMLLLDLPIG